MDFNIWMNPNDKWAYIMLPRTKFIEKNKEIGSILEQYCLHGITGGLREGINWYKMVVMMEQNPVLQQVKKPDLDPRHKRKQIISEK